MIRLCACINAACINAAQDEPIFFMQSFRNNLKECNYPETSTSFYGTFTLFVRIVFMLRRMISQTDDAS